MMVTCPNGHGNPDHYNHCGQCGAPLMSSNWSATQATTIQQPGWYDDPNDLSAQRYWDGHDWTPQRQRRPSWQPSSAPVTAMPPHPPTPPIGATMPPPPPSYQTSPLPVGSWHPPTSPPQPLPSPMWPTGQPAFGDHAAIPVGSARYAVGLALVVAGAVLAVSAFFTWGQMSGWFNTSDAGYHGVTVSLPGVGSAEEYTSDVNGVPDPQSELVESKRMITSYASHPGGWAIAIGILVSIAGVTYLSTRYRSPAAIGAAVLGTGALVFFGSLLANIRGLLFKDPPYWSENGHYSPGVGLFIACVVALTAATLGVVAVVLERRSGGPP
jgi:hypothetical protein